MPSPQVPRWRGEPLAFAVLFGPLPVAVLDAKIRSSSVPAGPGKIAESVSGKCLAIPACVEPLAQKRKLIRTTNDL